MFDPADLSTYTRTAVPIGQAALALDMAVGLIQSVTGQQFTAGETTIRLSPDSVNATKVFLPQVPARVVSDVVDDDGEAVTDYTLRGQALVRDGGWPGPVTVTYTHGFDTVPQVVRAVAVACASRVVTNPTGVRQVAVGSVSTSYAGTDGQLTSGAFLTPDEVELLRPFSVQRVMVGLE